MHYTSLVQKHSLWLDLLFTTSTSVMNYPGNINFPLRIKVSLQYVSSPDSTLYGKQTQQADREHYANVPGHMYAVINNICKPLIKNKIFGSP